MEVLSGQDFLVMPAGITKIFLRMAILVSTARKLMVKLFLSIITALK